MTSSPSSCSGPCAGRKSCGPLFLRLALGIMIFTHGAQKLLGWFGGPGYSGAIAMLTHGLHLPWILAFLAIIIEFFGGILLILGLATRFAAFFVGLEIAIAALLVHVRNGFFMNWGAQPGHGEGYEFHLLVVGIALALISLGGGCCSLDRAICRGRAEAGEPAAKT